MSFKYKRAAWSFVLPGGRHELELLHGEMSGRRIIGLDGKEVVNKKKFFDTGSTHVIEVERNQFARIVIKPSRLGFAYICTLNGRSMEKYQKICAKQMLCWELDDHIIEFDASRGIVLVDGSAVESESRFAELGTEHVFEFGHQTCKILCRNVFGGDELKVSEQKENELLRLSDDGRSTYELQLGDTMISPKK